MKYAIDQIEKKYVLLEEISTGNKKEVDRDLFDNEIYDGMVVTFCNGKFIQDSKEEKNRIIKISEKFNRLRGGKKVE